MAFSVINTGMSIISNVSTTAPNPQPNTAANEAALKTRVLGDPFQDDVICHLKMDGTDEGTTFTDTSGNAHTFSATGSAVTDTDIVNFGTASLKCISGVSTWVGSSTLTIASSTTDFTLDAWIYIADDAYFGASRSSGVHVIFAEERNAGNANQWFCVTDSGAAQVFQGSAITSGNQSLSTSAGLIPYEEWHHIALSYDNAAQRMYIFVDGVRQASRAWTTGGWYTQNRDFICGGSSLPSYTVWASNLNGYVDDWRVTEACRYRHSFTPPAMQYLDNVGTSEWPITAGGA